jgi:general secretion pathway protein I
MRVQRGFTLVEALVTMVVIAASGLALFTWVYASVGSLNRVEQANARNAAVATTLEFLETVNPMERPSGSFGFGSFRIEWNAVALTPVIDGSGHTLGRSDFQIALYDMQVKAFGADEAFWFDLQLRRTGFKKVRNSGPLRL